MSQPILSLQEEDSIPKGAANLLPCRIHHNGSIDPIAGYWSPIEGEDGIGTVYFRGRKLRGKKMKLPKDFRGIVAARPVPQVQELPRTDIPSREGEGASQQSEKPEVMKVTAEFDEITLWGHEVLVDVEEDPYVRGLEEWLQVADQIHSYESPGEQAKK
ncbi:ribonuclease H2, subunit C [Stachybotrys elegans]|uniref:Ribonuclease H2, subunit C n=1 Tax=Stachybotrys elegans TaxID=80388 RepID=A0A8K0WUV9_9HYPO|nr:ribonuclease H2, subunit C [Stachybotrys elegans]